MLLSAHRIASAVVLAWAFPCIVADLPIHCKDADAEGTWELALFPASARRSSCGHGHPDDSNSEPLLRDWRSAAAGASTVLTVDLLPGGRLQRGGNGEGSWTLVSDEALEVRLDNLELLAFFGFKPLPADDGGEHLPLGLQRMHSHCNETVLGWYKRGDREAWGCWYGRRSDTAGSGSFLQRRSRASLTRGRATLGGGRAAVQALQPAQPTDLDWRNSSGQRWVDTPAKQGMCGSCYAVSATQMLSARHRISAGDPSLEGFSAAFPLRCSEYTQGCRGGYPYLAAKWSEDIGLVPESCATLEGADTCALSCDLEQVSQSQGRHRAVNHRYVRGGEDAMIEELQRFGPLAVSFKSDASLLEYTGGIWEPPTLSAPDDEDGFVAPTHSALLVGFGVDAEAGPYWRLQNAWGAEWGEQGSFRIRRDAARERGMENLVVAADVARDERPGLVQEVLEASHRNSGGAALLEISQVARRATQAGAMRDATSQHGGLGGHRGAVLCVEPANIDNDQSVFVRIDVERNFRSLSFGASAGTETAVQCAGPTPSTCHVATDGESPPQCAAVDSCPCDLHGQGLPYPGMQALAEKVRLMCSASADPVRVLLIGLGGGAISSFLQDQCSDGHLLLENIEKDGRVANLSSKFFGFSAGKQNTLEVTDGLTAVGSRPQGAYDAVLVDCFAGHDRVPLGCRSTQFISMTRALLKGDGILLQNAWGRSSASKEVSEDFKALSSAYVAAFGDKNTQREVVFDAPQSLEYIVYGLRGNRWSSLLPDSSA